MTPDDETNPHETSVHDTAIERATRDISAAFMAALHKHQPCPECLHMALMMHFTSGFARSCHMSDDDKSAFLGRTTEALIDCLFNPRFMREAPAPKH